MTAHVLLFVAGRNSQLYSLFILFCPYVTLVLVYVMTSRWWAFFSDVLYAVTLARLFAWIWINLFFFLVFGCG